MREENTKRVTIRDVARLSGVSYQTVSRVLNNSPDVSDKTRKRVLHVIDELNYQPNKVAQMLTTNRSYTLETIILGMDYVGSLAKSTRAMVHTAKEYGYSLLVSEADNQELPQALENAAVRLVDGIVLYAPSLHMPDEELLEISRDIPFVRRDYVPESKIAWVGFDQVYAMHLAVEHLIALGHTQIAEISPPRHYINGYWRHRSWEETICKHGLKPGPSVAGDFSMQSGYAGTLELLNSGEEFTAVVIGTDKMALGALHAFRQEGLCVPDDVSVVGFDNAELTSFVNPPLTTVEFKFEKQDELAVKYLIELIKDPDIEIHQRVLMPDLIVRESTKPPK